VNKYGLWFWVEELRFRIRSCFTKINLSR